VSTPDIDPSDARNELLAAASAVNAEVQWIEVTVEHGTRQTVRTPVVVTSVESWCVKAEVLADNGYRARRFRTIIGSGTLLRQAVSLAIADLAHSPWMSEAHA